MFKPFLKFVPFFLFLTLGSVGYFATGCGTTTGVDVGGEIADDNLNPTDDNSLGGEADGSTSDNTGSNDDSSSSSSGGDDGSSSDSSTSSSGGSDDSSTTGNAFDDSSSSSGGATSSSGGGDSLPQQASIPPPAATKPIVNEEDTTVPSETSQDATVVLLFDDATENCEQDVDGDGTNEECQMVVSSEPITEASEETSHLSPPLKVRGGVKVPPLRVRGGQEGLRRGWEELFTSLKSLFTSKTATADSSTLTDICNRDNVVCCPVVSQTNNPKECYTNFGNTKHYIYLALEHTDANRDSQIEWSDVVEEEVNHSLLWFNGKTQSLGSDGTNLFAVVQGDETEHDIAKATLDGSVWDVIDNSSMNFLAGDYTYDQADLLINWKGNGERFDYESTNSYFGIVDSLNGISLYQLISGTVRDTGCLYSNPNAEEYTFIRVIDGSIKYGIQYSSPDSTFSVFDALDGTACDPDSTKDNSIHFIDSTTDTENNPSGTGKRLKQAKRIIAFDSTELFSLPFTFIAHTDADDKVRLRIVRERGKTTGYRFGGDHVLGGISSYEDIVDLLVINQQTSTSTGGKIALLNKTENKVHIVTYNIVGHSQHITWDETLDVTVGTTPVGMVVDDAFETLYVVNQGDATVTAIGLTSSNFGNTDTVNLTDYAPGKSLTFSPTSITVIPGSDPGSSYLIVGTQDVSAVVINPSDFDIPSSPTILEHPHSKKIKR